MRFQYKIITLFSTLSLLILFYLTSLNYKGESQQNKDDKLNHSLKTKLLKTKKFHKSKIVSSRGIAAKSKRAISSKQHTKKSTLIDQINKLYEIKECYKNENCNYPRNDPKSYHFAVSLDLKRTLMKLHTDALKKQEQTDELEKVAQDFLRIQDGHVKSAALHLLSSQEKSETSLNTLLEYVLNFHDASLIPQTMMELQRYLNEDQDEKIHYALIFAIQRGAPAVSQTIVKHIAPFITENSFKYYQQSLKKLSKKTTTYKDLKNSLKEFVRLSKAA